MVSVSPIAGKEIMNSWEWECPILSAGAAQSTPAAGFLTMPLKAYHLKWKFRSANPEPANNFTVMQKWNILIVDDHRLFRSGLRYILEESKQFTVVAEASNGAEFLQLISKTKPHLVIMDINMPVMNGIEATRQAITRYPDLKILVLSMYGESEYYNTLLELGVRGFVLKEADIEEFFVAINKILAGGT